MHRDGVLSIWFFIGALLLAYGVVITAVGVLHLFTPPVNPPVLAELHADLWWGMLLLVVGGAYTWRFAPRRPVA